METLGQGAIPTFSTGGQGTLFDPHFFMHKSSFTAQLSNSIEGRCIQAYNIARIVCQPEIPMEGLTSLPQTSSISWGRRFVARTGREVA